LRELEYITFGSLGDWQRGIVHVSVEALATRAPDPVRWQPARVARVALRTLRALEPVAGLVVIAHFGARWNPERRPN
jgi:hypothetical protein